MRHQVVYVMSTNFAGSTLLGLILGSHRDAMFLGEPSMIVRRDALGCWKHNNFCAICGNDWHQRCPVWKPSLIARIRERREPIYDLLVADSPPPRFFVDSSKNLEWLEAGIRSGNVDASVIHISKAVHRYAASVLTRGNRQRMIELIGLEWARNNEAIRLVAARNGMRYLHVTYCDFVNKFDETLEQLGAFLGFDPEPAQREFWTHPHHYIKGNSGTLTHFDPTQIEREPGLNRDLYTRNHRTIFLDEKWKDLMSHRDLHRLMSLPEVEQESRLLGHDLSAEVRPSIAWRLRGRIVAKAIHTARRIRSVLPGPFGSKEWAL